MRGLINMSDTPEKNAAAEHVKATQPVKQKTEPALIDIKLTAAHRHGGIDYQTGDLITVDSNAAEFIINHNVGVKA